MDSRGVEYGARVYDEFSVEGLRLRGERKYGVVDVITMDSEYSLKMLHAAFLSRANVFDGKGIQPH